MKKKPQIFYNPIDGSAPLSVYWVDGPKGDAVESLNGNGVGFFSPSGDFLGAIFDDVEQEIDQQELLFPNGAKVGIKVIKGKISISELVETKQKKSA